MPTNGEDKGYLFWLSWFAHNLNAFTGNQDANGTFWRGTAIVSCSSLLNNPVLIGLLGPLLPQLQPACPQTLER